MKNRIRELILKLKLDSILACLLRLGLAPRALEPLAPLPSQYKQRTLRKIRREGLELQVDLSDLPDWKIYFRRIDRKRSWIYQFLKPGMKVWEIGCHKGWVALHLAQAVGPAGRVIAIDGKEEHVALANERFLVNGLSWAKAQQALLFSKSGQGSLTKFSSDNSASFTISAAPGSTTLETADEWQRKTSEPDPDLVKLTINGWELHALLGAEEMIKRRKPALVIEVGDANLHSAGHSAIQLRDFLRRHHYQIAVREKLSGRTIIEPPDFPRPNCLEDVYANPLT